MTNLTTYRDLVTTNGAVCLYRTAQPGLAPFAVFLTGGDLLDTFTDRADADEFADDARNRMRAGLPWPDPDERPISTVHASAIADWAIARIKEEALASRSDPREPALLPCGCYDGACYCGQYPTDAEWSAMQADVPDRTPLTAQDIADAEWTRNFCDGRSDN